jgi:hypothetical protein
MNALRLLACSVSVLASLPAAALRPDEVRIGGVYYHDLWNDNTAVRVLAQRGDQFEVQFIEGPSAGDIDWVYPSVLLTRSQSQDEAIGEAVETAGWAAIGGVLLYCLFDSAACAADTATSPVSSAYSTPSTSAAPVTRTIQMNNECHRPVALAVQYVDANTGAWTAGWWNVAANTTTRLLDRSSRALALAGNDAYYYAEIPGTEFSWSGEYSATVDGRAVSMARTALALDDNGQYALRLTCTNVL